ncbi:MAG: hypothetical protein ACFFBV_16805 [Promethearchaeota archaeon]
MTKSVLINFRATPEDRRLLAQVARRWQTTKSEFLRQAIYKAAGVNPSGNDDGQGQQAQGGEQPCAN